MRKLSVLIAILSMAVSANATMSIVAPSDAIPGTTFSIGVDVVGESALITDVLAVAGNVASIDASGVVLASNKVTPYFEDLSDDPDFQAFMADLGITDTVGIFYYEFVDVAVPPAVLTDGALFSNVMVTAGDTCGDIIIGLADAANGVLRKTYVIPLCIPEPMTIALLGLGGLLLRRRR